MTTTKPPLTETKHGVMMQVHNAGVLIIGKAGIGKSSFALELIQQGHKLIADDIVEFMMNDDVVTAHCPELLKGLLHSREIGLIQLEPAQYLDSVQLNYVVTLTDTPITRVDLTKMQTTELLGKHFPCIELTLHNPAQLSTRLITWITQQNTSMSAEDLINQRQLAQMQQNN